MVPNVKGFGTECQKLLVRARALQRSEERYEAAEKRALLEIDRERTVSAKAQKEIAQIRQNQEGAVERHRNEVLLLQADLGDARQKIGISEGMLQEIRAHNQQQTEELQSARESIVEKDARNSLLERDLANCRAKINELEQLIPDVVASKPRKRVRRSI